MNVSNHAQSPIAGAVRAAITLAGAGNRRGASEASAGADSAAPTEHPSRGRGPRVIPGLVDDAVRAAIASVRSPIVEPIATDTPEGAETAVQPRVEGDAVVPTPLEIQPDRPAIDDAIRRALTFALTSINSVVQSDLAGTAEASGAVVAPTSLATSPEARIAYDAIWDVVRQAVTFTFEHLVTEQQLAPPIDDLLVPAPEAGTDDASSAEETD